MTDVTYYRQILHDQTEFLNSKIEKYLKILDDELDQLPESVVGQIRLVIGQSRLFINERFKQFSGLVDDCEQRRGEKEIKLEDLAGFWDMISYQIDDLKSKYSELEQLQSNEWKLTQPLQTTVINGSATNGFANKMNGNRHLDNNHQQNGRDTIDGDKKPVMMTKKVPARSNFREFLKAKKQEKHVKNDTKLNNGNDSKINGHHENGDTTTTTSTNGHHNNDNDDNDIQIMILVNNNNNNNNHNVKHNGGHQPTTKDVKSDNDCSETSKNNDDDSDNNEPNTHQNDDDGESNKKKNSIQVPVN
ncbi:uncharacterized protein LOC113795436 [Dermatophagoides pteronyssinus]|uniref:uncharacterized protein LOC113795436 n=1 Tax=Dermatophagoides pteronyssinus TaxID=6956 RepID=UPI003F6626DF